MSTSLIALIVIAIVTRILAYIGIVMISLPKKAKIIIREASKVSIPVSTEIAQL